VLPGAWSGVKLATWQLSVADGAVQLAVALQLVAPGPVLTVMSDGQPVITGAVVSFTVTVALHVLEAPWLSVTVRITLVVPSGYVSEWFAEKDSVSPASGSEEPLFSSEAETVAVQFAPAGFVTFWQMATGGRLPVTVRRTWVPGPTPMPLIDGFALISAEYMPGVAPAGTVKVIVQFCDWFAAPLKLNGAGIGETQAAGIGVAAPVAATCTDVVKALLLWFGEVTVCVKLTAGPPAFALRLWFAGA
jgi:hypothetical protein